MALNKSVTHTCYDSAGEFHEFKRPEFHTVGCIRAAGFTAMFYLDDGYSVAD